jgi:hypothetical protein
MDAIDDGILEYGDISSAVIISTEWHRTNGALKVENGTRGTDPRAL